MHFAVCDFLLDIVQNSIEAGASTVQVTVDESDGWLSAIVQDDGRGMDEATLTKAKDPFYTDGTKHIKRKFGLGIPFLIQSVDQAGGQYEIESTRGVGTTVSFRFPLDGIDTPPLGDLPGFFLQAMCFDGDYELVVRRRLEAAGISYEVRRSELGEAIGGFTDAGALVLAGEFLRSQEEPA